MISFLRQFVPVPVVTLAVAAAAWAASARVSLGQPPPRSPYGDVVRIIFLRGEKANCYQPKLGNFPCIVAHVNVLYRSRSDGKIWSVSKTFQIDTELNKTLTFEFGAASPAVLRQLEPAMLIGELDHDAKMAALSKQVHDQAIQSRHYDVASDALVPLALESIVGGMADEYYRLTRYRLVVVSGTRDAKSQAAAMYDKLTLGDDIMKLYKNQQAASAIKNAYDLGQSGGKPADEIKLSIEKVIADQVQRGVFISAHLQAGAIDVRTRDLPQDVKDALWDQVIMSTSSLDEGMEETKPPHYHLQLAKPKDRIP